jgi:hypothetical protein
MALTDLTTARLPKTMKWLDEAEAAFRCLKEVLCSHPILVKRDFQVPMLVQTDACDTGLGDILSQVHSGEEHPIMYITRNLIPRENKVLNVKKECLAVKWALDTLKYYLLGTHFTLITDHDPLVWMARGKDTND